MFLKDRTGLVFPGKGHSVDDRRIIFRSEDIPVMEFLDLHFCGAQTLQKVEIAHFHIKEPVGDVPMLKHILRHRHVQLAEMVGSHAVKFFGGKLSQLREGLSLCLQGVLGNAQTAEIFDAFFQLNTALEIFGGETVFFYGQVKDEFDFVQHPQRHFAESDGIGAVAVDGFKGKVFFRFGIISAFGLCLVSEEIAHFRDLLFVVSFFHFSSSFPVF